MKNKRLLIIVGVSVAIYLVYLFVIRKWMEKEGMATRALYGSDQIVYTAPTEIAVSGIDIIEYNNNLLGRK